MQSVLKIVDTKATAQTESLREGVEGNLQTLRRMREFVLRDYKTDEIVRLAQSLVSGTRGHDFASELRACFGFSRDSITYRRDPLDEQEIQSAPLTLTLRHGDCVDKSILLACLCAALGHEPRFVVYAFEPPLKNSELSYRHVACEAFDGKQWTPLDPTPENFQAGEEAKNYHRAAFPVFDAERGDELKFNAAQFRATGQGLGASQGAQVIDNYSDETITDVTQPVAAPPVAATIESRANFSDFSPLLSVLIVAATAYFLFKDKF